MIKKTIYGSTNSSLWTFKTVVEETRTNIQTQESVVKVENFLGRLSSSSFFAGTYTTSYNVNGEVHSETKYMSSNVSGGGYVSLGSYSYTIKHTKEPTIISVEGKMSTSDFNPSYASASGNVTLTELHRQPEPRLISVTEKNPKLTGITNQFVTNLSKKEFNITAKLYDNAKITDYIVENSSNTITSKTNPVTIDYSKVKLNYENGKAKFRIGVTDSLNSTGFVDYTNNSVIPYEIPNLIPTASKIKRNGQLTGKVKLSLRGTFYNTKIGNTTNRIKLSYKYWKSNSQEPTTYFNIPLSAYIVSQNEFNMTDWNVSKNGVEVTDVDKGFSYRFKIKAEDSFNNTSEIELVCTKGKYLFAFYKNRVDFDRLTKQNAEVYGEVVLFEGKTNGNVYCTANLTDFKYIEIYYLDNNNNDKASSKIESPKNNETLSLSIIEAGESSTFFRRTRYSINNSQLLLVNGGYTAIDGTNIKNDFSNNFIYITKVVGYK